MKLPPKPNITIANDFLNQMHPSNPRHIIAMKENRGPVAKTFTMYQRQEAEEWITKQNENKANIYFQVNPLKEGVVNQKAKKSDMKCVTAFHVDVDDPSDVALEKINSFWPKPSIVIFSGGGYQAFWKLDVPLFDLDKAEEINKAIASELGGDSCHNVDRIMRVPGTINWPNKKKRDSGRQEALAYVV